MGAFESVTQFAKMLENLDRWLAADTRFASAPVKSSETKPPELAAAVS